MQNHVKVCNNNSKTDLGINKTKKYKKVGFIGVNAVK